MRSTAIGGGRAPDSSFARVRRRLGLFRQVLAACAVAACWPGTVLGAEVDLLPTTPSPGDGQFTQVAVGGEQVWQNTGTAGFLYFKRPGSFTFTPGQTLYLRVTYFDDTGGGRLGIRYDSQTNAFTDPVVHTRTSRVGSGRFVDGYFELTNVLFSGRVNGSDFRLICGSAGGVPFSIRRVTLSDEPFIDADFQLAISRPWQFRFTGPAKDYVDRSSLKGKVMAGYQGWFRAPNDIEDGGWRHWISGQTMTPDKFTVDMWPDLTEYDPASLLRAGDVMTVGGAPAHVFSSASYPAVLKHFRWMRKHDIDGAWLQRFRMHAGSEADFVLHNVSRAAAEEGRIWGVEYDVSGKSDSAVLGLLQADWQWLTTQFDILNDPRYVREDGKPVVFIWGLSVPDRNFTPATANAVVDWFKTQGCHVIGGIPNVWGTLSTAWQTHIAKYDGVLVWMSNSTSEVSFFNNRGQDYYPHVWPGFSWAHLKQQPANPPVQFTDRQGGQFYWDKGRTWINAGGDRLFLGMFDEYDEGTAIMPMTDDPPPPHTAYGRFINNQGKPSDWWMVLSDELKRMMLNQRANTATLPTVESLANRSNIGPEASIDLGAADINNSLTRAQVGDGDTAVETKGGRECRGNLDPATDRFMYFRVNDSFAFQLANGDVTIEVEYFDSFYGSGSGTVLGLQYDSTSTTASNPAFTPHPQTITTTNSGTWRTARFEISDAYFGNRQNSSSDFRLNFNGRKLNVNRIWVRLPEPKAYPFTWTNATPGPALAWSQNANWLGGIVAQPDPTSVVRFFSDQVLNGGTVPITNNLSGQVFNRLQFHGTASPAAATTINLTGNAVQLGGTSPRIDLEANNGVFGLTYDIATPIELAGTTEITGEGDATFRIGAAISGSGGITKTGGSITTLAGANSYSGTTNVNSGTLLVNSPGSLASSSAVNVSGEATLGGNGTINGPVNVASGGLLAPGGMGSIGTLTLAANNASSLTLNGNTLLIDLPNSGTTPDRISITGTSGTLVMNGANFVTLNASAGNVPAGTYTLMSYAAKTGEGTLTFQNGSSSFGNATLSVGSTSVTLTVGIGGLTGLVKWEGNVSGVWDGGSLNWVRDGTSSQAYEAGDAATFDDSGSNAATISSAAPVSPAAVFFNNSTNHPYTVSAVLAGAATVVKSGSGTITLTGANTYTGATTINGGTFRISGNGRLGNGAYPNALTLGNGAAFEQSANGSQTLSGNITGNGGSLRVTGSSGLTLSGAANSFGSLNISNSTIRVFINNNAGALPAAAVVNVTAGALVFGTGTSYSTSINVSSGAGLATRRSGGTGLIGTVNLPGSGSVVFNNDDASTHNLTIASDQTLTGDLTVRIGGTRMTPATAALGGVNLSGNLTGSGGLVVASSGNPANTNLFGKGVLTLSGANTYAGATTVERGTLRLTQAPDAANANPGNDTSTVTIAGTGATLDLAYAGTDIVGKFYTGTIRRPAGVYGHGNSGANNGGLGVGALDAYFGSGSGTLTVVDPGFTSWIDGAFANGQVPVNQRGPNDDPDKDGIRNLIEYAIDGQDPTVANPAIGSFDGETLFFIKREGALGLTYAIEESTDLGISDPWEEATGIGYSNQPTTISHTFTPGSPAKAFARLRITQVP